MTSDFTSQGSASDRIISSLESDMIERIRHIEIKA